MNPVGESSATHGRSRGFCGRGQDHRELRRPQAEKRIDLAVNSTNAQPSQVAEGNVSKSKPLSVDAKEFYPSNFVSQQLENSYNSSSQFDEVPHQNTLSFQLPVVPNWSFGHRNLHGRLYNNWSPMPSCSIIKAVPEEGDPSYYSSFNPACQTKQAELATNYLIELMQHLTLNPGQFDELVTPLVNNFTMWLEDADTLSSVVNAIVEQSIQESNFRYSGARLCHFLDNELLTHDRRFRSSLLNRCKEEHMQISSYIYSNSGRLHGYVLFMAELFMQLECGKGYAQRMEILGTALLEAASLLLTDPTPGNIKCVCQVLKLTGQPLYQQAPMDMSKIMECLAQLLNNMALDPNIYHLISSVIKLRHVGWGDTSNYMPHTSTSQLYNPCLQNEPVFYGPDGQIMTPEESQFLQESAGRIPDPEEYDDCGEDVNNVWEPDDEMDEEIQAAFEQFLQMGRTQSKDSNSTHSECNG